MSSATASEKASDKRKASLQAKKEAEAKASKALGRDVKIVMKKPKKKIDKNGQAKKYMLKFEIKVNTKTGEITAVPKKKGAAKKAAVDSPTQ